MSKTLQWLLGLSALLLVLAFAASMILPFFFPISAAGYGLMGRGMMGGMGGFGLGMFTWPLLLIVLVVAGAFWLGRGQRPSTPSTGAAPTLTRSCPACGGSLQSDWKACPHCGERL